MHFNKQHLTTAIPILEALGGFSLGIFLLIGRWTPKRLFESFSGDLLYEPRLWFGIIAISLCLLIIVSHGKIVISDRNWHPKSFTIYYTAIIYFFVIYMISTLMWAVDYELALQKAYEITLVFIVTITIHITTLFVRDDLLKDYFWLSIFLFSIIFGFIAIQGADETSRTQALGGGPNVFGRNMGLFVFSSLYFIQKGFNKYIGFIFVFLGIILTIASGSRGAMLSLLIGGLAYFLIKRIKMIQLFKIITVLIIFCILCYVSMLTTSIGQKVTNVINERIIYLTIEEQYDANRMTIYKSAMELGHDAPFLGSGLSAFKATGLGVYPHNIFLEIFTEGGLVGLTLLLLSLVLFFIYLIKYNDWLDAATVSATIMLLMATQVSGDLYDSRGLFILLVLCSLAVSMPKKMPDE